VNEGLKLSELVDAAHCVNAADAVQHVSQIIFIFVQLHFIFIHSQVASTAAMTPVMNDN